MTLPAPNLDDRRFQELVDDAKRLVQQRCPEWTDHNVSDPGVTLIETFAYMVDQLLYRLNRVPDRVYVKFLEMIGVRLFPPVAARVPVTFWLSAPVDEPVLVPGGTEVATVRTELEESITFSVLDDLAMPPCSAAEVLTELADGSRFDHRESLGGSGFSAFSAVPQPGDALLVGLSDPVPRCAIILRFTCTSEGIGIDPRYPPLRWEAWTEDGWARCDVDRDETGGLNRSGYLVLHVPPTHAASVIETRRAGWIRAVITELEEGQPGYASSPRVTNLSAFTIGGTMDAINGDLVINAPLGTARGVPGERFALKQVPVVPGGEPPVVESSAGEGWVAWTRVADFADSDPEDLHYVLDEHAGEVIFGPAVRQPDGSMRQFGATPEKDAVLRVRSYRTGGGKRGNVATGAISVIKIAIPHVTRVENRQAAAGGVDGETIEEAKLRGPVAMRTRNRAVTEADFEQLTREAAPEVARVRCVSAGGVGDTNDNRGAVRVLIVPAVTGDDSGRLRFEQLLPDDATLERVTAYLDARRVVGTRVLVESPTYQGITVVARIRAKPLARATDVEAAGLRALYRYFDPLVGGPDGAGWPFGRPVHAGEVYAVLQRVAGVEYVEDARLFGADPISGQRGDAVQSLEIASHSLVFSYEHLLRVESA